MRIFALLALLSLAPVLSACGTSCDCPRCPGASTTVVTPPSGTTYVTPNDD